MKSLLVFYSRTGTTRKVAEDLSGMLGCDVEEIVDFKNRTGSFGYLLAGRDAMMGRLTEIKAPLKDPSSYDLVVVGTPVWGFRLSSPVRTYLARTNGSLKRAAFFCTKGGSGGKKAFKDMEDVSGVRPLATLELTEAEVSSGSYKKRLEEFAGGLRL